MIAQSEIKKQFHQVCKVRYTKLGFTRQKNGYWRVVNDVLQTFSLQFSRDGRNGRICFGIYPLCMDIKYVVNVGEYYVGQFDQNLTDWSFDKMLCSSAEECLATTFFLIDSYLIPFFRKAVDCQSAFVEMVDLDFRFDSFRKKRLKQMGDVDEAEPIEIRTLLDSSKFYMSLKTRNYDWAQKHIALIIQSKKESYERALKMEIDDIQWKNAYCQKLARAIDRMENELSYLNGQNYTMIDSYLERQEKANLERFKV